MRSNAIEEYKQHLSLSTEQREILIGILLGDATLESQNGGRTYRLKIEQSQAHEAYVQNLYEIFQPWVLSPPRQRTKQRNGRPTKAVAFSTVSHAALRFYAQQFYQAGKKCVPRLIHRWLTPRSISYWFMDDGSIKSSQSKGLIFNTQGFPVREVERLREVLTSKFHLDASLRKQQDGWQIYISGHSYETFVALTKPYVIESMQYKMPPPRRTRLPKE